MPIPLFKLFKSEEVPEDEPITPDEIPLDPEVSDILPNAGRGLSEPPEILPTSESFWDALVYRATHPELSDLVENSIPSAVGAAETLVAGAGQLLAGATGIAKAYRDSVLDVLEEKVEGKRPLIEPLRLESFDRFLDNIPAAVEDQSIFMRKIFHPRTEAGQAIEQMLGMGFDELMQRADAGADEVFARTMQAGLPLTAATNATIAKTIPAALGMIAGVRFTKGDKIASALENAVMRHLRAEAEGEKFNIFSESFAARHGKLTPAQAGVRAGLLNEFSTLSRKDVRSVPEEARLRTVIRELDKFALSLIQADKSHQYTRMRPDDVIDLATGGDELSINLGKLEEIFSRKSTAELKAKISELSSRMKVSTAPEEIEDLSIEIAYLTKEVDAANARAKPSVMIEENLGVRTVTDGLEEAIAAKMLGHQDVPVTIKYKQLTAKQVDSYARAVDLANAESREVRRQLEEAGKKKAWNKFAEMGWDSQYTMKQNLLKQNRGVGIDVVAQQELMSGATTKAKYFAKSVIDKTHAGLDELGTRRLHDLISSMNVVRIDKLNQMRGRGQHRHARGLTGVEHSAKIRKLEQELGPTEFADLSHRARLYFAANKVLLRALHKEGILSTDSYRAMRTLDYSKIEYLDRLDPVRETLKTSPISVRDSGVYFLEKGKRQYTNLDAKELLIDHSLRVYSRIFRNRANRELSRFATEVPNNPYVANVKSPEKAPPYVKVVQFFQGGKEKYMALDPGFAEQWTAQTPEMRSMTREILRWASGTPIVKATAVGYNPTFFLTDMPRNFVHMFMAATKSAKGVQLYSSFLPQRMAQQTVDMLAVSKDAWTYGPRFQKLMSEGAFPQFLAHMGQGELSGLESGSLIKNLGSHGQTLKQLLSKLNEFSELEMRMAVAERAKKLGLTDKEAAYEAKRLIDYSQYGRVTKVLDNVIPFLNPSVQATRTALRGFKEAPAQTAWLQAQMMAVAGIVYVSNLVDNPEGAVQISDEHMATGLNFVLPARFATSTPDGDVVHPYIHIKLDNALMPAVGYTSFIMRKVFEGRTPSDVGLQILRHTVPLTPQGAIPPSVDAMFKYLGNTDLWFGRQVSLDYDRVDPHAEYRAEHERNPTEKLYVEMARWLHDNAEIEVSPDRTAAIVDTFLADHPFATAWSHQWINPWKDVPDYERRQQNTQLFQQLPGVRRVMKMGSTGANLMRDLEEYRMAEPTVEKLLNDQVDGLISKAVHGEGDLQSTFDYIMNSEEVPVTEKERLANRATSQFLVQQLPRRHNMAMMPPLSWWRRSGQSVRGTDRARAFYQYWSMLPTKESRDRMMRVAEELTSSATGYNYINDDFYREFQRLRKEGDELSPNIGFGSSPLDFWRSIGAKPPGP